MNSSQILAQDPDYLHTRLRMLSVVDLEDGRLQLHANYRVCNWSNDLDGAEYYLALFDTYTAEIERRRQDGGQ